MSAVLVTGAAGFIGSNLTDALLARGETVVGLDNFNDYYSPERKRANLQAAEQSPAFRLVEGDILDDGLVEQVVAKYNVDRVVHLAARAGVRPSIADPALYERVNVTGTRLVFEAARRHGVKNVVFASSSSVYGNQEAVPFSEDSRADQPVSPYAATKRTGELIAHTYAHLYGLPITCLRFFTVYGERGRPDMAPYLFAKAVLTGQPIKRFGDGTSARDYTYIRDLLSGITAALDTPHPYAVVNLGSDHPISLNEFIALIERVSGQTARIEQHDRQPGDVDRTWADLGRARTLLGYQAKVPLEEGLERFVAWLKPVLDAEQQTEARQAVPAIG